MSNGKLYLKDYIGQDNINIDIEISIKGQKFNSDCTVFNFRTLKSVILKKDEKGNTWVYINWKSEDKINLEYNKDTCSDCGYSGLTIGEYHPLDNLYVITKEHILTNQLTKI